MENHKKAKSGSKPLKNGIKSSFLGKNGAESDQNHYLRAYGAAGRSEGWDLMEISIPVGGMESGAGNRGFEILNDFRYTRFRIREGDLNGFGPEALGEHFHGLTRGGLHL